MTSTIRRPGARAVRAGFLAAPFVGLAVAVALVWQSSYAAFSATTDNGVNNWTSGSVTLSDTDGSAGGGTGTAMFNVTGLKPGASGVKCIQVNKGGDLAANVRLYGQGLQTSKALADNVELQVELGTGPVPSGGECGGFSPTGVIVPYKSLTAFAAAANFSTGVGEWAAGANSDTRSYRFTYRMPTNADNGSQGGTAQISFVWEAQTQNS